MPMRLNVGLGTAFISCGDRLKYECCDLGFRGKLMSWLGRRGITNGLIDAGAGWVMMELGLGMLMSAAGACTFGTL
jgi:hypothetical protein